MKFLLLFVFYYRELSLFYIMSRKLNTNIHLYFQDKFALVIVPSGILSPVSEPCFEKTRLRGFCIGRTQSGPCSHRRLLDA